VFVFFGFFAVFKCNIASLGFISMCFARGFAISSSSTSEYNGEVQEKESIVFTSVNVGYLILSSTLGIVVGDVLWLEALCILGAKHVIVIDSIKPFGAAILGRLVLDEVLMPPAWGGMVLTVVGVGVVAWEEQRSSSSSFDDADPTQRMEAENVAGTSAFDSNVERTVEQITDDSAFRIACNNEQDQDLIAREEQGSPPAILNSTSENQNVSDCAKMGRNSNEGETQTNYKRGYACAIFNVLADSVGSLLTKKYGVGMTTWSINLIRFGFAGVVLAGMSAGMRLKQRVSRADHIDKKDDDETITSNVAESYNQPPRWFELPTLSRKGWVNITTGVVLVTFLCPALSNYSLFQVALGLAVSLGSVGPLYGLILDWPFKGKRPTVFGCVGVFLAVTGVIILCFWGT
jgi:drug/metabolite transporter (DMT)-like permease